MDLEVSIPVIKHIISHLQWWLNADNTMKGRSLRPLHMHLTINTDASMLGYGGHVGKHVPQGLWSEDQQTLHINLLELDVLFLTVNTFERY